MAVEFKFSSSDAEVTKALESMARKTQALKDEMRKLKEESSAASKAAKEGFDGGSGAISSMVGQVTAAASAYISLGAAIGLVTKEIQNMEEAQDKAADSQKTTADAQIKFLRNLGPVAAAEKDKILKGIREISKETGQTEATVYGTVSSAASARGSLSREAMLDATRLAARLAPESGSEQQATAGGLLDLAKVTGSGSAKENAGFMLAMGAQARVESLEAINKALVPATIGVAGYGGKPGDAGALVSTMTAVSGDQEGRFAGTAALQLTKQLEEFMPEKDRFSYDERGRKKLQAKGTGFSDPMERIRRLQADPALREKFLSKASFEEKGRKPIEQILTGGSEAAKLLERNAADYPTGEAAAQAAEGFITDLLSGRLQESAGLERKLGAAADRGRVSDFESGDFGRIRRKTDELLQAHGGTYLERTAAAMDFRTRGIGNALGGNFESGPEAIAIDALRTREASLTSPNDKPLPGQDESVATLREMVLLLRQIKDKNAKNVNAHTE